MPEKKKREKVVAEITLTHLTELAEELGCAMSREDAIAFLNQKGRAYDMWKQMMLAGEAYIQSALSQQPRARLVTVPRGSQRSRLAI